MCPNRLSFPMVLLLLLLAGCAAEPDIVDLYAEKPHTLDPLHNPVIIVPGTMGSKLVDAETGQDVWGTFGIEMLNPFSAQGAQLLALPMKEGKPLGEIRDAVVPAGALDKVVFTLPFFDVEVNAYYNILKALEVGGYRDAEMDARPRWTAAMATSTASASTTTGGATSWRAPTRSAGSSRGSAATCSVCWRATVIAAWSPGSTSSPTPWGRW